MRVCGWVGGGGVRAGVRACVGVGVGVAGPTEVRGDWSVGGQQQSGDIEAGPALSAAHHFLAPPDAV